MHNDNRLVSSLESDMSIVTVMMRSEIGDFTVKGLWSDLSRKLN